MRKTERERKRERDRKREKQREVREIAIDRKQFKRR